MYRHLVMVIIILATLAIPGCFDGPTPSRRRHPVADEDINFQCPPGQHWETWCDAYSQTQCRDRCVGRRTDLDVGTTE